VPGGGGASGLVGGTVCTLTLAVSRRHSAAAPSGALACSSLVLVRLPLALVASWPAPLLCPAPIQFHQVRDGARQAVLGVAQQQVTCIIPGGVQRGDGSSHWRWQG
jgi:hypothetical protein